MAAAATVPAWVPRLLVLLLLTLLLATVAVTMAQTTAPPPGIPGITDNAEAFLRQLLTLLAFTEDQIQAALDVLFPRP